jgi:hypothetical protein
MPVDFTTFGNTLQARLNGVSGVTTATELLLLAKASESSIGNANVSAVNAAGSAQVTAVNDAGTEKVNAVNTAGTTQVTAVNSAATNQITAVNNAGAAWLNGSQPIPAAVVSQIRGPQGIQGPQGPVGATFSVSGSTLTIQW